jgi:hypothetical protein
MLHAAAKTSEESYKNALRLERQAWDAVLNGAGPSSKGLSSLRDASLAANDARVAFLHAPDQEKVARRRPAPRILARLRRGIRDAVQGQKEAFATLERGSRLRGTPDQDLVNAWQEATRRVDAARRSFWAVQRGSE